MGHMRRISIAVLVGVTALTLILPALAPATLTEVGVIPTTTPATVPSCPGSPCLAVSRTTGFQVKVATTNNLLGAPRAGTIVAWTITLGSPNATQTKFFNENEGGVSEAGIAILAPQRKPNLTYKLVAQSPVVKLQPYFGKTAQFPLETTIPVKKGYIVALTAALSFAGTIPRQRLRSASPTTPPGGRAGPRAAAPAPARRRPKPQSAARCSTTASIKRRA